MPSLPFCPAVAIGSGPRWQRRMEANSSRSVASFLLPVFASYKALKTADPAQLTPWLMYWVVFGCALLVESWTEWFLSWCVPCPISQPIPPVHPR
ncbi:HVA22/TB2/DP1 family protein [Candidatus Bathyarchaeota archaeon]|nr:HVA22/TB2/DP1 family protein [Candidatus Bathyarchaeota archaeon]